MQISIVIGRNAIIFAHSTESETEAIEVIGRDRANRRVTSE